MKIKKEIAFVILHYNVIDETFNCVESIKKTIDSENYQIVVVDNYSPNKSGEVLQKKYRGDSFVSVILSEKNLGFAKGNNLGMEYARENFDVDFICCVNNDTLLEDKNFLAGIKDIYSRSGAAVIGPKIILRNGEIQKFPDEMKTVKIYEHSMHDAKIISEYGYVPGFLGWLKRQKWAQWINSLKYKSRKKFAGKPKSYYEQEHKNIILHGSCLIFTPAFFSKLTGFCPDTFLYCEENILFVDLMDNGLTNIYSPKIQMRHLEDAATDSIVKDEKEKNKFIESNRADSLQVLIRKLKESKFFAEEKKKT